MTVQTVNESGRKTYCEQSVLRPTKNLTCRLKKLVDIYITIWQSAHMTKETQELIDAYKKEYLRVNGREIKITVKGSWVNLGDSALNNYRHKEIRHALDTLRTRASFYPDS